MDKTPNRNRSCIPKDVPDGKKAKPRLATTDREKFARAMTRAVFGRHYWNDAKQAEVEQAMAAKNRSA